MNRAFSLLAPLILSRAGSVAFGLIALVALIWLLGPILGLASAQARLMLIGALIGVVLLYQLVRFVIVRRRGARLGRELASDDSHMLDIQALQEKMKEAISALKSSDLGIKHRGSAALYALPWFMIIGPSAAGKSTLLRNSGLHFPYSQHGDQHIQGFGGTRNCDWWFSDEAVILDTAGRYTTESEDHPEWMAFLRMLRRYRSRRPVNGVIVAVSMPDILTADAAQLERHVKIIRERINELITTLKLVFPVYLVFTKVDLVKGFGAYFEDLGAADREQVWGFFLDPRRKEADLANQFDTHIEALQTRLESQRFHKLALQRRLDRKAEVFDFPNQLSAARERLRDFVTLLFKPNPYQEMPEFSGVYLTSGTQEGKPLERIIGSLSDAFGYSESAPATESRAYFIKDLFSRVIFPNREAVARTRKLLWGHRIGKSLTAVAGIAAVALVSFLLAGSYTANALLLHQGERALEDLQRAVLAPRIEPARTGKALLDAAAHHERLLAYEAHRPLRLRGGTYRAGRHVEPLEEAMVHAMHRAFYSEAVDLLERRLAGISARWADADAATRDTLRQRYYDTLRLYLMMTDRARMDRAEVSAALAELWSAAGFAQVSAEKVAANDGTAMPSATGTDTGPVVMLVDMFMERFAGADSDLPVAERDASLVGMARAHLSTDPSPEYLYAQVTRKAHARYADIPLTQVVGRRGAHLVTSEVTVHGMYTHAAWQEFISGEMAALVDTATRGDWVIDGDRRQGDRPVESSEELAAELMRRMRGFYFDEYRETWTGFVGGLRVGRLSGLNTAVEDLLVLSDVQGPLAQVARWIAQNLYVQEPGGGGTVLAEASGAGRPEAAIVPELDRPLQDIRRVFTPMEEQPVSERMSQYLALLSAVHGELQALASASDPARDARLFSAALLSGRALDTELYKSWVTISSLFSGIDAGTRRMVEPLFRSPVREAWRTVVHEASRDIEREWQNVVTQPFQRRLADRFPFDPRGEDAAIVDVVDFFHPDQGILWRFAGENLSAFMHEQQGRWRARDWIGIGPRFSPQFFAGLERARNVSSSLFAGGGREPMVTFHLYPIPTPGMSEVTFESNGQIYRYRNEPQEWRRFVWPGESGSFGARIRGLDHTGRHSAERQADGVWGLFRLLSEANLQNLSGDVYATEWRLQDNAGNRHEIRFRLRADRQQNFIQERLFAGFRLPSSPFGEAALSRAD
jgi:type VI secretion system protein ImpL